MTQPSPKQPEANFETSSGHDEVIPEHTLSARWLVENSGNFNANQLTGHIKNDFLAYITKLAEQGEYGDKKGLAAASDVINNLRQALVARVMGVDEWSELVPSSLRDDFMQIAESPQLQGPLSKALMGKYDEISTALRDDATPTSQAESTVMPLPVERDGSFELRTEPLLDRKVAALGHEGSIFIQGTEAARQDGYLGVTPESLRTGEFNGVEVVALDQYPRVKGVGPQGETVDQAYNYNGTPIALEVKVLIVDRSTGKFKGLRAGETVTPELLGDRFDRLVPITMSLSKDGELVTFDKLLKKPISLVMARGAHSIETGKDSPVEAAHRMVELDPPSVEQWTERVAENIGEQAVEQVIDEEPDPSLEVERIQAEINQLVSRLSDADKRALHFLAGALHEHEIIRYNSQLSPEARVVVPQYTWLRNELKRHYDRLHGNK